MTDPHTLLLVPPPGDATLLASEPHGGRVPQIDLAIRDGRWAPYSSALDDGACEATALLLVHKGAPVAMGIDRAYRVARPVHDERRRAFEALREARAKRIYAAYPGAEKHPWIEGGSSGRQHDARYEAFNALIAEGVEPVEGAPSIMGPTYAVRDAIRIARWAADMIGGRVIALDADGREVTLG